MQAADSFKKQLQSTTDYMDELSVLLATGWSATNKERVQNDVQPGEKRFP